MDRQALARKNLEKRFAQLRQGDFAVPNRGWIRAIREALGMTSTQLASRMGVKQQRISVLEKAETTGVATLKTLREAAEAMDCTLVYAMIPTRELDEILRDRAAQHADRQLQRIHHTMRLENQALTPGDLAAERERLIAQFINGAPRRLWEDE